MDDVLRFLRSTVAAGPRSPSDDFFYRFLDAINMLIPSRASSFWIHNKNEKTLTLTALRVPANARFDTTSFSPFLSVENSLTGRLLLSGKRELLIPDARANTLYVNHSLAVGLKLDRLLLIAAAPASSRQLKRDDITAVINLYIAEPPSLETSKLAELISLEAYAQLEASKLHRHAEITSRLIEMAKREEGFSGFSRYLQSVTEFLVSAVGAEAGSIFLLNEQEQVFELQATTAALSDTQKRTIRYPQDFGLTGRVGHTRAPLMSRDLAREPVGGIFLEIDRRRAKSFIAVPIPGSQGQSVGVLRCVQKRVPALQGVLPDFSSNDLEALSLAASIVGLLYESRQADLRMEHILEDISHEVRSPLAGLRGRAAVLRRRALERSLTPDYLNLKLKDVEDMAEFVTVLIEGASVLNEEVAQYRFAPTLVFGDVVIKWCQLLQPVAGQRKMHIEWLGDRVIPKLHLDARRFEQVIFNLLMNAIKYGDRGTEITVEAQSFGDHYTLAVRNTGIEIPRGMEEMIFLRGFRAKSAVARAPVGKGVGLAVVKRVIEAHGGKVLLSNTSGRPTEFVLGLPKTLETRPPR